MENTKHFDYIIIGAGAAGLMLANAMVKDDFFKSKSILLLDKDAKKTNDRTWCFWEKGDGKFDSIVSKKWDRIYFGSKQFSKDYSIAPYQYKMVQGIDFYRAYFDALKQQSNVTFKQEQVTKIADQGSKVIVLTDNNTYSASKVFSSSFDYKMATHQEKYPVLQQHFLGWTVKTEKPIFNPLQVTYMDFSVPQKGNTRFMYILPFSKYEALVEYTLFSKNRLEKVEYEEALINYLGDLLKGDSYRITEIEQGSIPMTSYDFSEHHTKNIRYIGTAGGWAKPSTGYTFMSTAKKIPVLVDFIKTEKPLNELSFKNRFWFYDLLFLDVLSQHNEKGHSIFESLFKKCPPQLILKFLDEDTTFLEDLRFISSSPTKPFVKALLGRIT
ncbi:lycopene cyclase family protein [Zobellia russellii]|uniref:lycopene cyclase family protein n=1 Tax=Zobellia russellii TaxID=248907 RepID=UPI001BFEF24F|nr:lycopene cyclase family protein [Zobellia russellii]MBT9186768.1 lycopene cyclase [Zobellia russellii]